METPRGRRHGGVLADLDRPLLRERSRPALPWVLAVLVALGLAAVAGALYYSPLSVGPLSCPEVGEVVPPVETEQGGGGRPVCLIPHRPGLDVSFTTALRNRGPLSVTVHDIAFEGAAGELLEVLEITRGGQPDAAVPPLVLPADGTAEVSLTATMLACETQRSGRVVPLPELAVRASLLGIGRTVAVELPEELALLLEDC